MHWKALCFSVSFVDEIFCRIQHSRERAYYISMLSRSWHILVLSFWSHLNVSTAKGIIPNAWNWKWRRIIIHFFYQLPNPTICIEVHVIGRCTSPLKHFCWPQHKIDQPLTVQLSTVITYCNLHITMEGITIDTLHTSNLRILQLHRERTEHTPHQLVLT